MTAFLLSPRNINCTITFRKPYALLSTIHLEKWFFFFFAFLKQILYILSHICYFLLLVNWSCPTLCYSINCSLLGYSVHVNSLGKNTGVGCHALSRGSSQPRDKIQVSCIAGRFFTISATREAHFVGHTIVIKQIAPNQFIRLLGNCDCMNEKRTN